MKFLIWQEVVTDQSRAHSFSELVAIEMLCLKAKKRLALKEQASIFNSKIFLSNRPL